MEPKSVFIDGWGTGQKTGTNFDHYPNWNWIEIVRIKTFDERIKVFKLEISEARLWNSLAPDGCGPPGYRLGPVSPLFCPPPPVSTFTHALSPWKDCGFHWCTGSPPLGAATHCTANLHHHTVWGTFCVLNRCPRCYKTAFWQSTYSHMSCDLNYIPLSICGLPCHHHPLSSMPSPTLCLTL